MKIVSFFLCVILISCSTSNIKNNYSLNSDSYFYDEQYHVLIKKDPVLKIQDYKNWREQNQAFLYINNFYTDYYNFFYNLLGDSAISLPGIKMFPPNIPSGYKNKIPQVLHFQFAVDTTGEVQAVELIDLFSGTQPDMLYIANRIEKNRYGWKSENISSSDKDLIKEGLTVITNWQCPPAFKNGKKIPYIILVPVKVSF